MNIAGKKAVEREREQQYRFICWNVDEMLDFCGFTSRKQRRQKKLFC